MRDCLNHTEVLLDAGYHPVMMGPEWGYPELEHDAAACLKLTLEGMDLIFHHRCFAMCRCSFPAANRLR